MDAVYEALKKVMPDTQAHEVATKFNWLDEVATKSDLEVALAKQDAKIERMGRQIIVWVVVVGLAVVGLIKYL